MNKRIKDVAKKKSYLTLRKQYGTNKYYPVPVEAGFTKAHPLSFWENVAKEAKTIIRIRGANYE